VAKLSLCENGGDAKKRQALLYPTIVAVDEKRTIPS
jgi:hypothetical protein